MINNLFNKEYILELLTKEVLPLYDNFATIKDLEIKAYKKHIWEKTYHIVTEYKTIFINKNNEEEERLIFCSAHHKEPRKNVYDALKFLWDNGFNKNNLSVPRALFFSEDFNGIFYEGVEGNHLYHYIRKDDRKEIENIIKKFTVWLAKLHALPTQNVVNFNPENSRIKTVVPGSDHFLSKIKKEFPENYNFCKRAYDVFIKTEEDFLRSSNKLWVTHGDAHPENVINVNEKTIAMIDFTDLCLTDFTRDLGCFLQQLNFMYLRKNDDKEYALKIRNLFLTEYFKNSKIELTSDLEKRINNYYYWTAMRTAGLFINGDQERKKRTFMLWKEIENWLDLQ